MPITIYVLHDSESRQTYIWHASGRNDGVARIKSLNLLGPGSLGYLYRGPTGVDKMESLGTVHRPSRARPAKEKGDG